MEPEALTGGTGLLVYQEIIQRHISKWKKVTPITASDTEKNFKGMFE